MHREHREHCPLRARVHTPKAVTYHEQSHYCRYMIGHSLGRMGGPTSNIGGLLQLPCTLHALVDWP